MGNQDGGPFGRHKVGLKEKVGKGRAAGGELCAHLLLERSEVNGPLSVPFHADGRES